MSSTQRHYKWLKAELPRLEEEGVLDSASRERLAAHCTTRLNECTGNGFGGFFLTAMCVIGMLFITAGIVMLIAYNWHEFGKTMQIAIGMAPLVIAGILSVFTLVRLPTEGVKTMCFREASALLTACGIATSIAVISQIYQISGDIRDYMLVVLLLSLPHIYLFKSRALFIIFICAIGVFNIDSWRGDVFKFYNVCGIIFAFSVLPFMFREFISNNKLWRVAWSYISLRWLGFFICAGIASMMYYCPGIGCMLLVFLSCLCIKYLGVFAREKCTLANGWRWSGLIYFLIVCAIKSFDDSLYYSLALHINVRWAICMIFFMALLAYMAVTDFRKHRMESERIALLAICAAMCLSEFTYLFELGIISVICANCALAVYSIVMISKGIRSVSLSSFNEGLLTAIVLVCCRFFDMDISMLVRGVGMILLGTCFCVLNVYFAKVLKKRSKEVAND